MSCYVDNINDGSDPKLQTGKPTPCPNPVTQKFVCPKPCGLTHEVCDEHQKMLQDRIVERPKYMAPIAFTATIAAIDAGSKATK